MRIYLAGPMTGYKDLNHPMFDRIAAALRAEGYEVVSPAEMDREIGIDASAANPYANLKGDPTEIMRMDLRHVLDCDGIAMLPGWIDSSGARLERVVAESTGRKVFVVTLNTVSHVWQDVMRLEPAPPWHHELIWRPKCPSSSSS